MQQDYNKLQLSSVFQRSRSAARTIDPASARNTIKFIKNQSKKLKPPQQFLGPQPMMQPKDKNDEKIEAYLINPDRKLNTDRSMPQMSNRS